MFWHKYQSRSLSRSVIAIGLCLIVLISLARIGALYAISSNVTAPIIKPVNGQRMVNQRLTSKQNLRRSTTMVAAVQSSQVVPACQPYDGSTDPTTLNLNDQQPGLTQVIDSPAHYQIYGNTAQSLTEQVAHCAPGSTAIKNAEFTAVTSYRLSWQYNFRTLDTGKCVVKDPKVGLHITMILPNWQPTFGAQADLPGQWQTFMNNLINHENGHVALDVQHAQTLISDLQSLPATDCASISSAADYLATSVVNTLNQANDNYDTTTNHGATQGAILP